MGVFCCDISHDVTPTLGKLPTQLARFNSGRFKLEFMRYKIEVMINRFIKLKHFGAMLALIMLGALVVPTLHDLTMSGGSMSHTVASSQTSCGSLPCVPHCANMTALVAPVCNLTSQLSTAAQPPSTTTSVLFIEVFLALGLVAPILRPPKLYLAYSVLRF